MGKTGSPHGGPAGMGWGGGRGLELWRCAHFAVLFQGYYYFSPSVPFFEMSDSLSDFAQLVTPVDDRRYFSGLHKLADNAEVLFCSVGQ